MSAATVFPELRDAALQKLAYAILTSMRNESGAVLVGFCDRLGAPVPLNSRLSGGLANVASQAGSGRELEITIKINPDGLSASAQIIAGSPVGAQAAIGAIDVNLLAPQLT